MRKSKKPLPGADSAEKKKALTKNDSFLLDEVPTKAHHPPRPTGGQRRLREFAGLRQKEQDRCRDD